MQARISIESYMTPRPHTVTRSQTLAAAHRLMRDQKVRHLPVLDQGKIVGLVSDRDLHCMESLHDVDPERVTIEEAMMPDPLSVDQRVALADVVTTMIGRRSEAALVMDGERLAGVFTTLDAMRALVDALGSRPAG